MKQTKLLLATIAMLWCSLTASAHDFEVDGIYYYITSKTDLTVEVTYRGNSYDKYSNEYSGIVTIPSAVTYNGKTYRVTSIGHEAFYGCSSLTSITIPESVTSIGFWAFIDCSSLTSINVREGNTTYDSRDNCNAIIETSSNCLIVGCSATIIPESVTSIGYEAFYGCNNLTSITIPESVTSIGPYAFYGTAWYDNQPDGVIYINKVLYTYKGTMPENTSIEVKEGTISISPCAFVYCRSLTSITIPESVTSIGISAFDGCRSLTSITIPESVTSIGDWAFYECTSLKELVIEDGNETLSLGYNEGTGKGLFYDCPLETIYLGRNLSYRYGYSPFYDQKTLTSVTIGESVTSIGESAFRDCRSLTSITIPESVTSIGNKTFEGCTSLKELVIADGGETLSLGYNMYDYYGTKGLFYDCPLETVYLGRNLSYINNYEYGYSPFYNKKALTSVTIGESVTSIGYYAFRDCSSLTSITIPESVTEIGDYAFCDCSSLTSITIPESVTEIGDYAFCDCSSLISITIPENSKLRSIGESTFRGCSSLPSIAIPESVTEIGDYAFCDCSSLTSITIPENSKLRSIGESTFRGCSSLTSITIPESVTSIGNFAFYDCTSLKELVIADGSETLSLGYNYYNSSSNKIGEGLFYDCPLETIYLGRNLSYSSGESYGYSPFYNKKALTSVTIGDSVTSIEDYAFNNCSSLTSITIPESVTSFGYYAFLGCGGELTINCNIPSASQYAYGVFYKSNFTKVSIGEGVTNIGSYAFYNCSSLNKVYIKDIEAWCNIKFGNINSNPLYYAHNLYLNGELVTELTIPNTVTAIKSYAFVGCSSLTSVTIPESVTSIGSIAFYECSGLTSITIPENLQLTSIGQSVFCRCSSLTSITIPESVTSIGDWAFSDCSSLTSITIPESSQLTSIGYEAFRGCSSLTSIIIPESVRSIGLYAFKGCSSLTSITLSEGVTSIGDDSFSGCSNVENLVVKGSAMPHVPSDKLKKIVLYSPAPLQSKGFSATVYQNCMLYVPQQGLARYQIVEPWVYFWNIIAFDTSDIAPAELPEDDSDPIIYDLRGQRVDVPTRGNIYIVNGRKVLY